ncbi:hypothetical protein GGR56DRAFT_668573 [Xylariaceae sp. FL0804]|nr:hypothetical protein GGR56DRAFT_668573 [Xylariaceae sp. FL0804]
MASRIFSQGSRAMRPATSFMASRQAVAPRTFTTSLAALKHKESASQEYDPETHKQDLLEKQKKGQGHWKPELASDSEEAVKADRHHDGEDIAKLQERTKAHAEETSKKGTSMRDGL